MPEDPEEPADDASVLTPGRWEGGNRGVVIRRRRWKLRRRPVQWPSQRRVLEPNRKYQRDGYPDQPV